MAFSEENGLCEVCPSTLPLVNFSNMTLTFDDRLEGNGTGNLTEYVPYEERIETYVVPAVFAVVFLAGFLGNGTLICIFLLHKTMRTVPNTYIMSLAVGDFILIVGTVPFIGTIYFFETWPYGELICKVSEFLKDVSMGVTVFTLTMLSLDRYIAIVLPIKKHTRSNAKTRTILIALGIWMVSIVLALPGAYFSFLWEVPVSKHKSIYVCYPFPDHMMPWYPKLIVLVKFLLLYKIPLIFIGSFYIMIARHLIISSRNNVGQNPSHLKQLKSRTKVAKIVLAFVLIFAVCFFPSHVFLIWYYFDSNSNYHYNQYWHSWKIMGYVLTFANSCLNPIALYLISSVFRNYFKKYLFCCCCKPQEIRRETITGHSTTLRNTMEGRNV
ncbi:neuropeptide CCHamide-1 receptor-like [Uloborus diversus]|uniref:neuropeptide CCHamide-1 receptor-like n=1 Tax=Uloborus diversus TaxID=327109 RepID=UPI0024090EF4|nr:neuropeptide CCHamide-1 receptor-like [Uloborus diversus]XP_054721736.1 neuropeptide CCHamide-1 receptor-like [Uloborus diversus]XP_054721737.1 neuropeptide CCHamide-1 receptor-like [Uloborus diversus]